MIEDSMVFPFWTDSVRLRVNSGLTLGPSDGLKRGLKVNTVHLRMRMHFAMLRHLPGTWCLGRNGYLLILRFTPRGFHRLRLETTRSSSISSRIVW